ncbi:MAG: hypothetical protein QOD43_1144 [Gaiellaceae bacterium]|nr:hypothetical protein [Gaiellaceae bacterium]
MRRKALILIALGLLAGAAIGGTFLVLSLTGSSERAALLQRAHGLVGAVPHPKRIRFKTHLSLPKLSALAIKRFERTGLNEKLPPTPVRAEERPVVSSSFPQTQVAVGARSLRFTRRALVNTGHAGFIAEPDIATNGRRVMITWNDGAAFSNDGGRTFTFADPAKIFAPAHGGFCCDQSVVYDPRQDIWIWVLQYWADDSGNIIRLAIAHGDSGFDQRLFHQIDISPTTFGWSSTAEFDYPDAGLTDANFFLTVNAYDKNDYDGTLVLRIPLTDLAAASPTIANALHAKTDDSSAALAAGARDTMYFASHVDTARLRLWGWPDSSTSITSYVITHTRYPYSPFLPYHCGRTGGPATGDWCERRLSSGTPTNDDRPTTAWVANGVIGVAWNAQQSRAQGFPYPFVMVVRIDEGTKSLIDEPFIWNRKYAFEYLDVTPNATGDLGGLVLEGGGRDYENCVAMARRANTGSRSPWLARLADPSDHDPTEAKAGDYLGASPASIGGNAWSGTCYTIHRGRGPQHVGIRFFSFGL